MLLEIRDLVVKYGEISALKGVSLQVENGQLITLIGANGAGKTTLLKAISGLLKPESGQILYEGQNLCGMSPDKIVRAGIAHCPEGRKVFPRQTIQENLRAGAFIQGKKGVKEDMEKYLAWFPRLGERRHQKAGSLSGGEQQMLVICRALMSRPKLLLLDEPSMGLAPLVMAEVFRIIKEVHKQGTTILLIEQNAKQALKTADRGYILEVGSVVAADSAENLLNSPDVQNSYLGA